MAMLDASKIAISLKKLLGKSHTDNAKDPGNEARFSGLTVAGSTVYGAPVPTSPTKTSLYDITNGNVEYVRLVLDLDPSSNSHAFLARLPDDYETTSTNTKKGTGSFVNGQVLSLSSGALQIVPPLYGTTYEAKPYRGGSAVKNSGTLVPPGDAVDWSLDYFSGVLFQEDAGTAMTHLECLIWIGDMVTDALSGQSETVSDLISRSVTSVTNTTNPIAIDSLDMTKYTTAKWLVTATKDTRLVSAEVLSSTINGLSAFNVYSEIRLGSPALDFFTVDAEVSGNNLNLVITTSEVGVTVNAVKINLI